MTSVLERLQQTTDDTEIWWDSPPLDFPDWRERVVADAPDEETRNRWGEQLRRFLDPENPADSLVRGVTTNPSLVARSVLSTPTRWGPWLGRLIEEGGVTRPEEAYGAVYREVLRRSARALLPLWRDSDGRYGWVSGQLDPRTVFDAERMLRQSLELAALGPNMMVKVPGSAEGYQVIERLVARGISVNSTFSYTVPQFLACARAVGRGLAAARSAGVDTTRWRAVFTHMIGRFGANTDLAYEAAARDVRLTPGDLRWAEIAVLKRIHSLIREKDLPLKPLLSSLLADGPGTGGTLSMHLEETAGASAVYTCKPSFVEELTRRQSEFRGFRPHAVDDPVPVRTLDRLRRLPTFRQAYEPDGMDPAEFGHYGCFVATYAEVLQNTRQLVDFAARQFHSPSSPRHELIAAGG
ncbi:transaldolase [Streptomyces durbertensis]|uniref:Transaldolase n=1 Tax=Streptomyces durbertensis TaxID=2448886 RepID=A0ABR6EKT8_9ACTN|nr:transaldolase family protein [Streptomyces durbertensis]MBB1245944.1 transaldolase [Streptomyces durbertensis]